MINFSRPSHLYPPSNRCIASGPPCNIPLRFNTSEDIPTLNQLVQTVDDIARNLGIGLSTFNRCGTNQTGSMTSRPEKIRLDRFVFSARRQR